MLIAIFVGLAAYVFYRAGKIRLCSFVSLPLLAFYLSFVATITVISRIPSNDPQYQLVLFWTYRAIANGETHYINEIFWIVVLFIPIGILFMLLLTFKHKLVVALFTSIFLSCLIEVIQLTFHRGLFEFDDIVHNTVGTVIGILVFAFVSVIGKRITGKT